jgi:hypothetical protein
MKGLILDNIPNDVLSNTFPSFDVYPASLLDSFHKRCYNSIYEGLIAQQKETNAISHEMKKVYLVSFNKAVDSKDYMELLKKYNMKPCINASNYLLGIMGKYSELDFPKTLINKCLVAAEPNNPHSIFYEAGNKCYLAVIRQNQKRRLTITETESGWLSNWAFLAEKI